MNLENKKKVVEFPLLRSFATMLVSEEWVEKVLDNNIEQTKKLLLAVLIQLFDEPKDELNKIWYVGFVTRTLMLLIGNDPVGLEKKY